MSDFNCSLKISETKAFKSLEKMLGNNTSQLVAFRTAIEKAPAVGKPFNEWYKDKYGKEPNLDGRNSIVMAQRIKEYYYSIKGSVNEHSAINQDPITGQKGYTSIDARTEGFTHIGNFVFVAQSADVVDNKIKFDGKQTDYLKNKIRQSVFNELTIMLAHNRNLPLTNDNFNALNDELLEAYDEGFDSFMDYIKEQITDPNDQEKNLLAMAFEVLDDNTFDSYLEEAMLYNAKLGEVAHKVTKPQDSTDKKEENLNGEEEEGEGAQVETDEDGSEPGEVQLDRSIENANNHAGLYKDFKLHVDDTIRTFLSSIYKLNSTGLIDGKPDYDLNNNFGIPTLMDANEVMTILYSCVDYTNGTTMLDSIENIANTIPGMAGLIQVVNKLKNDKDLRYAFYRNFGKTIVSKLETVLNNGQPTSRISNRLADRKTSLFFEFYNSSKRTCIALDKSIGDEIYRNLNDKRSEYQSTLALKGKKHEVLRDNLRNEILESLTTALKRHCPTVSYNAIVNFVTKNETTWNKDELTDTFNQNVKTLLGVLESFDSAAASAKREYGRQVDEHINLRRENEGKNRNEQSDIYAPFRNDYAKDLEAPTQQLSNLLLNYSVIKTELNSRNVHGNLSSDVINSSMITNIMKTLQNEVALKNFGDYKSKTNQYNLSNILVEKRDENNKIINLGLFKLEKGVFVPTTYANQLLKVRLFNGAGDENAGKNVLYSEMSKGDYVATAFINFFDENENTNGKSIEGVKLASYFMKIPSDAPKNFAITAPRYTTGTTGKSEFDLFDYANIDDEIKIKKYVENILNTRHEFSYLNGGKYIENKKKQLQSLREGKVSKLGKINKQAAIFNGFDPDFIDMIETMAGARELAQPMMEQRLEDEIEQLISDKKKLHEVSKPDKGFAPNKDVSELVNDILTYDGSDKNVLTIKKAQWCRYVYKKNQPIPEGSPQSITFKCTTETGEEIYYFIEGTLKENNGVQQLINPKFGGFLSYNNVNSKLNAIPYEVESAIENGIKNKWIKEGVITRKVNTNHIVYKQIRNAFIQELTDAGVALNTFFQTSPTTNISQRGVINTDKETGEFIFNPGYDNSELTASKVYDRYHVNGKHLLEKDENGIYHLTGNVFKSDRFIYTYKEDFVDSEGKTHKAGETRNFGQEILNEAFDFLYGGADNTYLHMKEIDKKLYADPTPAQLEVIDKKLSEFLTYLTKDAIDRVSDLIGSYNNIDNNISDIDNITEFITNYFTTYISFNDIFEGDSKFYKNTQDLLKRSKEVQGSGVPYGTFDITRPLTFYGTENEQGPLLQDSPLNEQENLEKYGIEHRPKFRGVTIANTELTGKTIGEFVKNKKGDFVFKKDSDGKPIIGSLTKKLISVLQSKGYTKNEAFNKAESMMSGYANTTVNDAQSYITFEEWVRRITARGQFKKYQKLIDAILDPDLSNEDLPLDVINEFVQVQKNFYYDQHYNKDLGVIAPRQIKNAEFVLIPRFIKGTELEAVYNLMKQNNIDQLNTKETSKAGKANILTLWDNNGELTQKNIDDFNARVESAVELYDYNYLYTQSETPQHMNAENKAAIQIMKKIMDNIDSNSKLYEDKQEFFNLYSENIRQSCESLLEEFGIETDNEGNIILDENGEIPNIDYNILWNRLTDEVRRQGLNSNLLYYTTPIEKGSHETKLPLDMGAVAPKIESIAQSLFNSAITRQKLPGYHAAQITNIGWQSFGTKKTIGTDESLKYHPNGEPYVEIMLPRSAFNFSDELIARLQDEYEREQAEGIDNGTVDDKLIKILEEQKLDKTIGYRIPTEGKQSVCVFKLKGFIDPALGSTIVVPNDWVAQTGSDFDIDSVYGIMYETYNDRDGNIHRVEYLDTPDLYSWYRYINKAANKHEKFKSKDILKDISSSVDAILDKEFDEAREKEGYYFKQLHEDLQNDIKEFHEEIKASKERNKDRYIEILEKQVELADEWLDLYGDDITDDEYENAAQFSQACKTIAEQLRNRHKAYSEKRNELVNKEIALNKIKFETIAKENGLLSYEDFCKNPARANTKEARNNKILSIMTKVLSDDESLEENLSRSNFDDVIDNVKNVLKGTPIKDIRNNRSSYNFLDQADYQEDAMSGAKLKAFSVTRDTFCSVCNTVKARLAGNNAIRIEYTVDDETANRINKTFGKENKNSDETNEITIKNGSIVVNHSTFGWSNNNHNVVDKILTAYNSQTTAHILDAIKEGAVPNVNDLTFGIYKLFTDIGSSFNISVPFMMQPAITRLVDNYNANKSIYKKGRNNEIHTTIKQLARDLGVRINGELVTEQCKIDDVISAINADIEIKKYIKDVYGIDNFEFDLKDKTMISLIPLNSERLLNRIKNNNPNNPACRRGDTIFDKKTFDNYVHDLIITFQYKKFSDISGAVTNYARCLNPDKFGAKQSIYATRKVFRDIEKLREQEENGLILAVENESGDYTSLLNAIYPDIDLGLEGYLTSTNNNSKYPPLHSFLKYATAISIKINRNLFLTQSDDFIDKVELLEDAFTKTDRSAILTEKQYRDYQNYILNNIYQDCSLIKQPLIVTIEDETVDNYRDRKYNYSIDDGDISQERARIYGFGYSLNPDFHINDINLPTSEEIEAFTKLSPAQKIAWIQDNFYEQGIFSYFSIDNRTKFNNQNIKFNENSISDEIAFNEFKKAYFSNHPLIRLAAIDLIKYSFVVEGFKMKFNAVNKAVSNECLTEDFVSNTNIVEEIKTKLKNISQGESIDFEEAERNYVRGHYESLPIETKVDNDNLLSNKIDDIIVLPGKSQISQNDNEDLLENYNIISVDDNGNATANRYIKLKKSKYADAVLYEIYEAGNHTYLIPLNKLESYENATWSSNPSNNNYARREYYVELISEYESNNAPSKDNELYETILSTFKDKRNTSIYTRPEVVTDRTAKEFDIHDAKFNEALISITKHFSENNAEETLYLSHNPFSQYIKTKGTHDANTGEVFCSIQDIEINGKVRTFKIVKAETSGYRKMLLNLKETNTGNKTLDNLINTLRSDGRTYITDLYYVEEFKPKTPNADDANRKVVKNSTASEKVITLSMRGLAGKINNEEAAKSLRRLDDKGIHVKDKESIHSNLGAAIEINTEYVVNTANNITDSLKFFCKDEEGVYHPINDDYSINLIKTNVEAREKYVKTCNEARSLVKQYELYNDLDLTAEDPTDAKNIKKINEAINNLKNNTLVKSAEDRFVNDFLSKISSNPLVQSDLISLLDGYHSTTMFDSYIGDLQETSNPLLQIITKEVMSDIRGKEMKAKVRKQEFIKALNIIKANAARNGYTIDYSRIIDDSGRFIQAYSNALVDDMNALRDAKNKAKEEFGEASNEYLIAKYNYDTFKLNYIHQPAPDTYYRNKLELQRQMLVDEDDISKGFIPIYREYQRLTIKRRELLSHKTRDGVLDDAYKEQLKEINNAIDKLVSATTTLANGVEINKYESPDLSSIYNTDEIATLNDEDNSNALANYLSKNKALEDRYFDKNSKFGFEEELQKNLDIIARYEVRDDNGNLITPYPVLAENDDYVKAKEWVENNATPAIPEELRELIKEAYDKLSKGTKRNVLKTLAREKEVYDANGIIDATKFSDEDIASILEEDLDKIQVDDNTWYSDRNLINAAQRPNVVYDKHFYWGMRSDGAANLDWFAIVNEINDILRKNFSPTTGILRTSDIAVEDFDRLQHLYNLLASCNKYSNSTNGKSVYDFFNTNVEVVYDEESFNRENELAKIRFGENSPEYAKWRNLNTELLKDKDGSVLLEDGKAILKPNHFIYGYIKPKNEDEWIDRDTTDAINNINYYTERIKTKYYYQKLAEMRKKSKAEYDEWFRKNHIYNPNKHMIEPISCWTQFSYKPARIEYNEDKSIERIEHLTAEDYFPKWSQTEKELKEQYKLKDKNGNYYYKSGYGNAFNYKHNVTDDDIEDLPEEILATLPVEERYKFNRKDNKYDNPIKPNKYELEIKQLMEETLLSLANTHKAKRFIEQGYLPMRAKAPEHNLAYQAEQLKQFVGWINTNTGNDVWYEDDTIDYSRDREVSMPMLGKLGQRAIPKKNPDETDEEYKARIQPIIEENEKVHKELVDNNWEEAIEEFIVQAGHYNAVQENKQLLFFAKNMLERSEVFDKKIGQSNLHKNRADSTEDSPVYVTKKDKRLEEQYVNWLRRLLYDQYKQPNDYLTRAANIMQSLTSSKFMMMNITGGISNVTLGVNQILGEAFAKEYFQVSNWNRAHGIYSGGLLDYVNNMYNDKSTTLSGAIIKFFNVVDFDEIRGVVNGTLDAGTALDRLRDVMFSPQTMGEHYMQNTAMFAMMESHRIIENNDANIQRESIAGLPSHKIMNESEYVAQALEHKIKEILDNEKFQKYLEFKNEVKKDANVTKDYAWYKKDLITEFVKHNFNKEEKEQYIKDKKRITEEAKETFKKAPTLYSQLKLDTNTGTLTFANDSIMNLMQEDEAYKLLGEFKDRVISVNKKIHGVYDRLGAARIENSWWGSLAMQYHKHLYPGIMKRWRRQGYWNEERGTVEKGSFWSAIDFIATPIREAKYDYDNLDESQRSVLVGLQSFMKHSIDFCTNISLNWHLLPEYERANIRRNLGDLLGWSSAILLAIGLRAIGDDDDDDKFSNIMYNLALYEADRLASESFMYNPIGLVSEAKTLWSSPLACQSEITDLMTAFGEIAEMLFAGEDYDGTYKTGLYTGENKIAVRLKRQIPIYRALERIWNLDKSNSYYKIGTTGTGIIPIKEIADWIKK